MKNHYPTKSIEVILLALKRKISPEVLGFGRFYFVYSLKFIKQRHRQKYFYNE